MLKNVKKKKKYIWVQGTQESSTFLVIFFIGKNLSQNKK